MRRAELNRRQDNELARKQDMTVLYSQQSWYQGVGGDGNNPDRKGNS